MAILHTLSFFCNQLPGSTDEPKDAIATFFRALEELAEHIHNPFCHVCLEPL
jgi:hypothetical protein